MLTGLTANEVRLDTWRRWWWTAAVSRGNQFLATPEAA
jgi:hypothetical protein